MRKNITRIFAALLISASMFSCTTTVDRIEAIRPPDLELEDTPEYVNDTEELDGLFYEAVVGMRDGVRYASIKDDGTLEVTDTAAGATHILFDAENYTKVGDIISLADSYKKVSQEQTNLVNLYILEANKLKQILELERYKSQILTDSWAASENLYRQERALRQRENVVNKVLLFGTNALWIVGAVIAL
jgi:hypothetical protein